MSKKTKKVKVRRLYKMRPVEDAFVPHGANDMTFPVVKESPAMPLSKKDILSAFEALTSVAKVLKAGDPDTTAAEALKSQVNDIIMGLSKGAGIELVETPEPTLKGFENIKSGLSTILNSLKGLSVEMQGKDLTMADKLDTLAEETEKLVKADMSTDDLKDGGATPPAEAPPAETPATEVPPAEAAPAAEAAATGTAAAPAAEAAEAAEAKPAEAPAAGAPPAADPPAAEPTDATKGYVTQKDLAAFKTELMEAIKGTTTQAVDVAKTAILQAIPATTTPVNEEKVSPEDEMYSGIEAMDLTQSPELKKIRIPGR